MNKYQIIWVNGNENGRMIEMASSKAPYDVSLIARECGYADKYIVVPNAKTKLINVVIRIFKLVREVWKCGKGCKILLQYPCFNERIFQYVKYLMRNRTFVTVVHDMNSIREKGFLSRSEISSLSLFDELIVHSPEMETCLRPYIKATAHLHVLGCFPYLTSSTCSTPVLGNEVCFAGNIDKSMFLRYLTPELGKIRLNLYGHMRCCLPLDENVKYYGIFQPENISVLRGSWGLIWDGDSIGSCSGTRGEYLRIIAPHKFSLYIAAGIPVIVWDQSAMAKVVVERRIGLTVSSLYDLEQTISRVSEKQYHDMLTAISELRDEVVNGMSLKRIFSII